MINIVMYRPQMPGNVGNIIRLCANFGCKLHILGPLEFNVDDRTLMRAGLDYHQITNKHYYTSFEAFMDEVKPNRLIAATTKGKIRPDQFKFDANDYLIFGRETSGLPDDVMNLITEDCRLRIPMVKESRCLNVSNSVAVLAYEAFRQFDFAGANFD